ncbi:YlaI family protein [Tuberibacillus calidus]|uniref:YlaI family protein n=1 Tax=Tuberibacillus calidus TaxID=340097 RepID=UPI0004034324|nr:YlaI family protein [Tuberibacillus calidus]
MLAKCMLCDRIDELDDQSPLAKKLRNRPIHTYLCPTCHDRITERTIERWKTGKFRIHHKRRTKDESLI